MFPVDKKVIWGNPIPHNSSTWGHTLLLNECWWGLTNHTCSRWLVPISLNYNLREPSSINLREYLSIQITVWRFEWRDTTTHLLSTHRPIYRYIDIQIYRYRYTWSLVSNSLSMSIFHMRIILALLLSLPYHVRLSNNPEHEPLLVRSIFLFSKCLSIACPREFMCVCDRK